MKIKAIKTHKITAKDADILSILGKYMPKPKEKSVVVVTSKIIAICEGRVACPSTTNKDELIKKEAEYYLPRSSSKYNCLLTIKKNALAVSAGVDESNANGLYILWPKDPQAAANAIRSYLRKKFHIKHIGVLITDSKTTPLRWGVTGMGLSHSGFAALNDYRGTPDVFGRILEITQVSVLDGLAAAAVLVMGEGKEQTPLAVIEDVPFVKFQDRNPTRKELQNLAIERRDDLYAPILNSVKWEKGGA